MTATRRGRQPKLDKARTDKIVDAIRSGNYIETAARYSGINVATLFSWLAKGRDARTRHEHGEPTTARDRLYADFLDLVEAARAEAEVRVVYQIQDAIPTSWQAGAWWLERSFPDRYGRRTAVEVTGAGGGPIEIGVTAKDLLVGRLDEMAGRLAALPTPIIDVEPLTADEALEA